MNWIYWILHIVSIVDRIVKCASNIRNEHKITIMYYYVKEKQKRVSSVHKKYIDSNVNTLIHWQRMAWGAKNVMDFINSQLKFQSWLNTNQLLFPLKWRWWLQFLMNCFTAAFDVFEYYSSVHGIQIINFPNLENILICVNHFPNFGILIFVSHP